MSVSVTCDEVTTKTLEPRMLSFSERVRVLDLAQEHGVLEKRQWTACTKTPARKETTTPRTLRV